MGAIALAVDGALGDAGVARDEIAAVGIRARRRRLAGRSRARRRRAGACGWVGAASSRTMPSPRCAPASAGTRAASPRPARGRSPPGATRPGETARTMALGFGELGGAGDDRRACPLGVRAHARGLGPGHGARGGVLRRARRARPRRPLRGDHARAVWRVGAELRAARARCRRGRRRGGAGAAGGAGTIARRRGARRRAQAAHARRRRSSSWSRAACTSPDRCRWTTRSPRAWTESRPRARIVPLREPAVVGAGKLALDLLEEAP